MDPFPYTRLVVIGATSSGKSTLAANLASRLKLDFIELDALHWEAHWRPARLEDFRSRVERATSSERWVAAGNYHIVRDLVWPRAEAVIWLDYSFLFVFFRLLTRTLIRSLTREELWTGNRESFLNHMKLWSEESLFHWLVKTYWRRKAEYPALFRLSEHKHLHIYRLRTHREAETWMRGIPT
jgi:adenylate kinase family enzyme